MMRFSPQLIFLDRDSAVGNILHRTEGTRLQNHLTLVHTVKQEIIPHRSRFADRLILALPAGEYEHGSRILLQIINRFIETAL